MSRRLYLIRHGESLANLSRAMDTKVPGPPLTALGRQQAEQLAERFEGIHLDGVVASSMTRAQQTIEPLARGRGLNVQVEDGLREVSVGAELEGSVDPVSSAKYHAAYGRWLDGNLDEPLPGNGESARVAIARFDDVIRRVAAELANDGALAVVSHGSALRLWAGFTAVNVPFSVAGTPIQNVNVVTLEERATHEWGVLEWDGIDLAAYAPAERP